MQYSCPFIQDFTTNKKIKSMALYDPPINLLSQPMDCWEAYCHDQYINAETEAALSSLSTRMYVCVRVRACAWQQFWPAWFLHVDCSASRCKFLNNFWKKVPAFVVSGFRVFPEQVQGLEQLLITVQTRILSAIQQYIHFLPAGESSWTTRRPALFLQDLEQWFAQVKHVRFGVSWSSLAFSWRCFVIQWVLYQYVCRWNTL